MMFFWFRFFLFVLILVLNFSIEFFLEFEMDVIGGVIKFYFLERIKKKEDDSFFRELWWLFSVLLEILVRGIEEKLGFKLEWGSKIIFVYR